MNSTTPHPPPPNKKSECNECNKDNTPNGQPGKSEQQFRNSKCEKSMNLIAFFTCKWVYFRLLSLLRFLYKCF